MKKGKVFSKRQFIVATLVICLAAAVWLNMKYSSFEGDVLDTGSKNLGDAEYVNGNNIVDSVETSTGVNYISTAREERNKSRKETVEEYKKITEDAKIEDSAKKDALTSLSNLAVNSEKETAIETVIKSKGFKDALAIISENSVTVIVPVETLLTSETLQIQDAVTSQTNIDLEKIKIITVK